MRVSSYLVFVSIQCLLSVIHVNCGKGGRKTNTRATANATVEYFGRGEETLNAVIESMGPLKEYNRLLPSSDGNVTTIKLSIKDIEVKEFSEQVGKERLMIEAVLVSEWQDSRIQFQAPADHIGNYSINNVLSPLSFALWKPSLKSRNMEIIGQSLNDITLLRTDGMVYNQQRIRLKPEYMATARYLSFATELTETRFTNQDLVLQWENNVGTRSPFSYYKDKATVNASPRGQYRIDTSGSTCERVERFGSFGTRTYSCVRVKFTFTQ